MNKASKTFTKKRQRSNSEDEEECSSQVSGENINKMSHKKLESKISEKKSKKQNKSDEEDNDDVIVGKDEITFMLNKKKRLNVRKFKGQVLVDIREFWNNDSGDWKPSKKGISLTLENWEKVKSFMSDIDVAIKNMK